MCIRDRQEATLDRTFAERLAAVEQLPGLAAAVAQLPALAAQVDELAGQVTTFGETRAQLPALAAQITQLEDTVSKMGNARELMPLFDRFEQELELRQAEEEMCIRDRS